MSMQIRRNRCGADAPMRKRARKFMLSILMHTPFVGADDGAALGAADGTDVDGEAVGTEVGPAVGVCDGARLGP